MIIAPSLLAADFKDLKTSLTTIKNASWLHLDVMDGHFVPNLSFGPSVIKALRPLTDMVFDTHLMVSNPERLLDLYIDAGSQNITFHIEATHDAKALIHRIHEAGLKAGISIKPKTPFSEIEPYLNDVDLVLVMSVEPGFGGQTFMMDALQKIETLKNLKHKNNHTYLISVDGGIDLKTAPLAIAKGADILVAGSAVFKSKSPSEMIEALRGH